MRLAMRLPEKKSELPTGGEDPREHLSAEIIDLASRNAYPTVSQQKPKSDALGLAAGVAIVGLLGVVTLWSMDTSRMTQNAVEPAQTSAPAAAVPVPAVMPEPAEPDQQVAVPAPAPVPAGLTTPQGVLARDPGADAAAQVNRLATPTVVFDASTLSIESPGASAGAATGNSASDFASRIGGVGGAPAKAVRMVDPSTTVTQGTLIPAVLETAINTDVPGYVRAVVSTDVRSFDGRRILVPRSSRLIGQYQSGLQAGQKRAYVIWTRLIRPDGVSVMLQSPGTDFSGETGLPGKVNGHFFKRFGSAMLLSVIGGLTTVASAGTNIIMGGGQSAASQAVAADSQIGPTVRVRQGEPIRVFTARDLDFSTVTSE